MPKMTDSVRQKAEGIHAELSASVAAIRANQDLNHDGRQRQIAASYVRAKRELDQLRQEFMRGADASAKVLSKDIFGAAVTVGADAISARDAADRASRLADAQEALDLLRMAEENGDDVLARAVAQRSHREARHAPFGNEGWSEVLAGYLEHRPAVADRMAELERAQAEDLETNFRNEGHFFVVPPTEISQFSESALAAMSTSEVPA